MKSLLFILLVFASCLSFAQDERFYRDIFAGNLYDPPEKFHYKVLVEGPRYMLDLNSDGKKDSIQVVKKDGVDFIKVNDEYSRAIFEGKLFAKGINSKIYKAKLKKVNSQVNVLILYYYEGEVDTVKGFYGSSRLYFLTIRDNDLEKITLMKGPYYWLEQALPGEKYGHKSFSVNAVDYNHDGQSEISVNYNHIQRTYVYQSDGLWREI